MERNSSNYVLESSREAICSTNHCSLYSKHKCNCTRLTQCRENAGWRLALLAALQCFTALHYHSYCFFHLTVVRRYIVKGSVPQVGLHYCSLSAEMITRAKSSLKLDYECPCHSKNLKLLHYKIRYTISDPLVLSFSDVSAIITPIKLGGNHRCHVHWNKTEFSAVCQRFSYDAYYKQELWLLVLCNLQSECFLWGRNWIS
jgi:hypothetical protein